MPPMHQRRKSFGLSAFPSFLLIPLDHRCLVPYTVILPRPLCTHTTGSRYNYCVCFL